MSLRRLVAGGLVALTVSTAFAGRASAHADLTSSDPAADSVIEESPAAIVLTFTEAIDIIDDSIRLVDADGDDVEIGEVRRDGSDETMAADISAELAGTYVVAWRAVSADSHPISGAFTFSVGQPTTTVPGLVDQVLAGDDTSSNSNTWVTVGRWLSYTGVAIAVGGFAVLTWLAPALRNTRRSTLTLFLAADVGVIGTAIMLGAQASIVGSGWLDRDGWATVIESHAGRWWVARLILLAVIPILLIVAKPFMARRVTTVVAGSYALALLLVVAAGGHGISGRFVALGFVATVVHLGAMSLWVGGVTVLVLVVARSETTAMAARFSPLALGSVVTLAVTGSVNAWRQLGTLSSITDSTYGSWLIVKLILVAGVVVVAVVARAQLRRGSGGLATSLLIESVGMVAVLAATAGLVSSPPPQAVLAAGPEAISVTSSHGDWLAQVDLIPATTGGTTMHVYVISARGSMDTASDITVTATLPAQQLGPIELTTFPAGRNHVTSNDADFPLAGTWDIEVTARFGDFDQVVFNIDAEIR